MTTGKIDVLLATPEMPAMDIVAGVIAKFTGGVLFDARQKARRMWGFLGENLSPEEAQRLVGLAAEAGLAARAVPADAVPPLPEGVPVHGICPFPEGMEVAIGPTKVRRLIPWEPVRLVAAAPLKETTTTVRTVKEGPTPQQRAVGIGIMMVTGLPVGMGKSKEVKKTVHETELRLNMDIFVGGEAKVFRLSVDADKFDYASLGSPPEPGVAANFRRLLTAVAKGATMAVVNLGARSIVEGRSLAGLGYESAGDYEKEIRWLLTIQKT
jgi:hypothetical protein